MVDRWNITFQEIPRSTRRLYVMIVVMHGYGCKAAHSVAGRVSRETVNTEKRGKKQPWTNNGIC